MRPLFVLVLVLVLVLEPLRAGAGDDDADAPPPPKPAPTAADLERKLDTCSLTVDWKGTPVLDAINELQQKTGVRFIFDQAFADFAAKRKVTFDGYAVTARAALRELQRACGFEVEPDVAAGAFKVKMDASAPTKAALAEKRLSVKWASVTVSKAIDEIARKTGIKVQLHATMRSRLSSRKITWDADDVTAREAIETLYVFPPPSVDGRIDAGKDMTVVLVYVGAPASKADIDFALDDRKVSVRASDAPLADAARQVADGAGVKVEVEAKLAKEDRKVTVSLADATLRAALDAIAKSAEAAWKVEGAKVVIRAAEKAPQK